MRGSSGGRLFTCVAALTVAVSLCAITEARADDRRSVQTSDGSWQNVLSSGPMPEERLDVFAGRSWPAFPAATAPRPVTRASAIARRSPAIRQPSTPAV